MSNQEEEYLDTVREEIEESKECLKETIQNTYAEGKAIKLNNVLKYIDQLESDKQKLIEKLVEDKIELTEELKYNTTKRESRIQLKLVDKYLEILKGENQVTVK